MAVLVNILKRHFTSKMDYQLDKVIRNNNNNKVSVATKDSKEVLNGSVYSEKVINCNDQKAVNAAAKELYAGNVIALPTDTVYGLACSANNPEAIRKLYDIKGRDAQKPVAICVAAIPDLRHWGEAEHISDKLLALLLPGAVTIVLKKSKNLDNPYLNPGVQKIGIRIPDFDFIQSLSATFNHPIALTSANRSSEKSTLEIIEFEKLWPKLGGVFDGGRIGLTEAQRAASTVVDLSKPGLYKIIRNGVAVTHTVNVLSEFGLILDS